MEFIKNCFKSLYDFRAYKELTKSSKLKTILYVVILSAVLGAVVAVPYFSNAKSSISVVENNVDKIPEFSIKNNNLELKGDSPVIIKDSGMVLIFDSSSDTNSEYAKADNAILWGKTCRKKRIQGKETSASKYTESKGVNLNKNYVLEEAKSYKLMPLKFVVQNIVIAYMLIFMTSLIIMTFKARSGNAMTFREIFKVSSFAVTAPIILFTCLFAFGIGNIPIISWVLVIIQALYVHKAIKVMQLPDEDKTADKKKKTNKK